MIQLKTADYNSDVFSISASNDALLVVDQGARLIMGFSSTVPCFSAYNSNLTIHGQLSALSYSNLPLASTSATGIVRLSTSTNSTDTTTAATSSAVAQLYPATQVIDVTTSNQTILKSGTSAYLNLRADRSNVGVNCMPSLGIALDVNGVLHATAYSNLPLSSTSTAGIVILSSASNSSSTTTAATSSVVAQLSQTIDTRIQQQQQTQQTVLDFSVSNQTILKSGTTSYMNLRADLSNVGVNCLPRTGITLDVNGTLRAINYANLPLASTLAEGIVMLSSSSNAMGSNTAVASSLVHELYQAVDVAMPNRTLLKNGANTYLDLRSVTSNVGINCIPSPGMTLDINGNTQITGDLFTNGNISGFSDLRYKTELRRIHDPLTKLSQLHGYTFERIDDVGDRKGKRYVGLVAQEVLDVLPEAVEGNSTTGLSVAYGNMVALLIDAVNELTERVIELESKGQ